MECLQQTEDGLWVVRLETPCEVSKAVALFEQIADEEGWQPGEALRRYADQSCYFAIVHEETVVGSLQVVQGRTVSPLPITAVWPELEDAAGATEAHVAVLAVRRDFRAKPLLFWLLCVELWRYCVLHEIERLWIEATPPTLRVYQRIGWPLEAAGPLREHWGEPCFPCVMRVSDLNQAILKKAERSPVYQRIVQLALRDGWTV